MKMLTDVVKLHMIESINIRDIESGKEPIDATTKIIIWLNHKNKTRAFTYSQRQPKQ